MSENIGRAVAEIGVQVRPSSPFFAYIVNRLQHLSKVRGKPQNPS